MALSAKIVDFHSHWSTRRGYLFRTEEELKHQQRIWKMTANYVSEEDMAAHFARENVRVMLDLGFTKYLDIAEIRSLHDYALAVQRQYPQSILGNWLQIHPRLGTAGVAEFKRCLEQRENGLVGLCISGAAVGHAASDPVYFPYYEASVAAGMPVLILVGYTALGAGMPGGNGVVLDLCHPRYVDEVAARFPKLTIIAGRAAWPWQDEMIAILQHKPNIWYELHGWSPKYFRPELKQAIAGRLQDRILFGADYPMLSYARLRADWLAEGYDEGILNKIYSGNACRLLTALGLVVQP